MVKVSSKSKSHIALSVVCILLLGALLPISQAVDIDRIESFGKGPSYIDVVPMKKVTFVNFDDESYLDDYAYLAAVPTAVFNQKDKLFSHPLLFYEDEYEYEDDKERSFNARQGVDYFMEDWVSYSYDKLDQMTLINVPRDKVDQWKANEYVTIDEDNVYDIACELALEDWSYSDEAVVAVVEEDFEKPDNVLSSMVTETVPAGKEIVKKTFRTSKLDKLNPRFHEFEVPEGYKYLKSRTWWASREVGSKGKSDFPLAINVVIPAADPDSQLYCKYGDEWMLVSVTQGWNIGGMDLERAESYVYNTGQWRLGITDVPTHGVTYGRILDILKNMIFGVTYQTDITMYPGVEVDIPDKPPFGCRDATFKLTWDKPNVNLGFSIIGPSGEEILSASDVDKDYQEIHLNQLGECLEDETYSISVFTLDELSQPVDFEVEYSWCQNFSEAEGDSLTAATEGAVLASTLNAPLLYTSSSKLSKPTEDALYKLGVKKIYLVNLGEHLSSDAREEIEDVTEIKEHYQEPEQIYKAIMDLTGQNDIIFTTIDPWTRWLVTERKPYDETEASLFVGPAAYCAAHHGSPVLIVDNHPELSSAVVYHVEFWQRHGTGFPTPPVAQLFLTGRRVVDFLKKHDFDREGEETMITVAGQYDLGATWDRTFVGKAKPGRIFGSPVDASYWIPRNVFYPALIFENPGMNPDGVKLTQGSESRRRTLFPWGSFGLVITKPSREETFNYPALQMYVCYEHHLNKRFETYYGGFKYKTATDIVPGVTETFNPIDEGIEPGKEGAIWPDLTASEVIPAYFERGGFDNVYSTSFDAITGNLNEGVLLLVTGTHGSGGNSGSMLTWDPDKSGYGTIFPSFISKRFGYMKESNPWRGYDWYLGSTENPDTLTMEVHGFLPALLGNPNFNGLFPTGEDFWPSERPILHGIFGLLNKIPILKWFIPEWLASGDYYKDGMVIAHTIGTLATSGSQLTGYNLDEALENVHSCGWINTACLPAYKYMHLTMVRHGSPYQVIDPWVTSWYGGVWQQSIPRDIALGYTIGEAFTKGISHVGILYATEPPQWWWDRSNNVCFFGDPDLRPFVPKNKYSEANYWEREDTKPLLYDKELNINGHMPFGATSHPHAKEPQPKIPLWVIVVIIIISLLVVGVAAVRGKKRK